MGFKKKDIKEEPIKKKISLLNEEEEEKEFIYKLTLEDAINFLKTIY